MIQRGEKGTMEREKKTINRFKGNK